MVCLVSELRSRTDYILGMDYCLFSNVPIQEPRHNSHHCMILDFLHSATLREHTNYLEHRMRLLLRPPTTPTREDELLTALRRAIPKTKA